MEPSVEFYFSDSDSEERVEQIRNRRRLRDASNTLDMPLASFEKKFRVNKDAFLYILNKIEPDLRIQKRNKSVPNLIKLGVALRFFGQGSCQHQVGSDYSLSVAQSTTSLILTEILPILQARLCPEWIKLEYSASKMQAAKCLFYEKNKIPGVIGAVDGTHVSVIKPENSIQHMYYNSKGFHSLNVMLICNHNMVIKYISARYPGSTHDSRIWTMSSVEEYLKQVQESGDKNTWLLADAGYPLSDCLMTPFRNAEEGSIEANFNTNHSKGRIIIERTIGDLKSRYRCLKRARELNYKPEKATEIINICAALHNICVERNVEYESDSSSNDSDEENDNYEEIVPPGSTSARRNMGSIRYEIASSM